MSKSSQQPIAVVTGASTGIGRAIAHSLTQNGWRVFGTVRKQEDGAIVQSALGADFTPLLMDVTDEEAIEAASAIVRGALGGRTLNGLVNNAGIAVSGPMQYLPLDEVKKQFDVNVYGVINVSKAFIPLLGGDRSLKGKPGRIVNMSSLAGRIASPFMGPYTMSKHALEAFSDTLRRELLVHGIDVVTVGPGAIQTPIWSKADDVDLAPYKGTEYEEALETLKTSMRLVGENGLPAEAVGDLVEMVLTKKRVKTRYAILKEPVTGWLLPQILPKRLVDKVIAQRFKIPKRKK